jgi:DNA-3-methyladenine glycosylase II
MKCARRPEEREAPVKSKVGTKGPISLLTPAQVSKAVALLRDCPTLGPVVSQHPKPKYERATDVFGALTRAIVSQQLSTKAADTIYKRVLALTKKEHPDARAILKCSVEQLREAGLSRPKAGYLQDLAQRTLSHELHIDRFWDMPDDDVIAELTAVKGLGVWSAHMFLMFALNRPDVWPVGDLGIKNGVMRLENKRKHLDPKQLEKYGDKWRPYRTVAATYIWMSLDNKPQ